MNQNFARFIAIIALVASASAQVKPRPSGLVPRQILLEMNIIEVKDGALGLSMEKGGETSRKVTPEQFRAELEKLALTKDADVLSAPKVITNAGQRAAVEIGKVENVPKSGITIDVLPRIVDGGLSLDVIFEYNRKPRAGEKPGSDAFQKLTTFVAVNEGATILLGGMSGENGRSIVLAVTASKVDPPPPPPAEEKPAR